MNSNLDRNNNPAQLKKQVVQDIKRVKDDLNEIKRSLSPGQIIDQLIFEHLAPGESLQYLARNPIGTSFLTIGSILLLRDEFDHSNESKLLSKAKNLKQQADDTILQTKTKFSQVKADVSSGIEAQSQGLDKFKDKVSDSFDMAKNKTIQAKEAIKNIDPAVMITLGAGLGVLSGFAVPSTSYESKFTEKFAEGQIENFMNDLQSALNKSINLVKNEFLSELSDTEFKFF